MKRIRIGLTAFGLMMMAVNAMAQTADEVVKKYFDALGGKEKMASVKTMHADGEMTIMNNPAPYRLDVIDGVASRSEIEFAGKKIISCYQMNSGWTVNPLAGVPDPTPLPEDQVKMSRMNFDLKGPLFDYAAKGEKLELLGKEKLGGSDVYKLKLTKADSTVVEFFIDSKSYFMLKMIFKVNINGNRVEIATVNSDFRQTNIGIESPFMQELSYPGMTLTIASKMIEFNKPIDATIFEMPKKQAAN